MNVTWSGATPRAIRSSRVLGETAIIGTSR
jgi:hypothetical protein